MKIRVIESGPLNCGNRVMHGSVEAVDLVRCATVSVRDWKNQSGYQRRPSNSRVKVMVEGLKRQQVDFPVSFLVGVRSPASEVVEGYRETLKVNLNGHKLYVIDAQHRLEALKRFLKAGGEYGLVPVNFVLGSSEVLEMELFHDTNATQVKISTSLAYDLMSQRYDSDDNFKEEVRRQGLEWIPRGVRMAAEMQRRPGQWKGRIHMPHEPGAGTTNSLCGFVNSLEALNRQVFFGEKLTDKQRLLVVKAYWAAIARILPDCFVADQVTTYRLQSSHGSKAMHRLLELAMRTIVHGKSEPDKIKALLEIDSYKFLRKGLINFSDENKEGKTVKGSDCWLSVNDGGVVGTYASNSGRRDLVDQLKLDWYAKYEARLAEEKKGDPKRA